MSTRASIVSGESPVDTTPPAVQRSWSRRAYVCAVLWAAAASYLLFHVPFEFQETYGNLVQFLVAPPAHDIFIDTLTRGGSWPQPGFLRTFSYASSKFLFDLSGGHYFIAYRAFHAVLILLLMLWTVRLIRPTSAETFGVASLSLAALLGMHTFHEAVRETEFNIKLLVPVLCIGAVWLADSTPRWWKDLIAVTVTFYAVLSNELGLLLWVAFAAAYIVGFRGVSRTGLAGATVVVAAYFLFRFVLWDVGAPSLVERSSGFGFRSLDPPELIARFGSNPLPLYAYNVAASVLTVFLAEPRNGVFLFVRDLVGGSLNPALALEVLSSLLTTAVMIWFVRRRWRSWLARDLDRYDRLFLVAVAVIAGNAVISYPYLKEVTMSTGGVFYVLGTASAVRLLLLDWSGRRLELRRAALVATLVSAISLGWTLRALTFYVDLTRFGHSARQFWAATVPPPAGPSDRDRRESEMIAGVRASMLDLTVPPLTSAPRWIQRLDPTH